MTAPPEEVTMNSDIAANLPAEWLERMHELWQNDASAVPHEWHAFFSGYQLAANGENNCGDGESLALKQSGVQSLLHRYRSIGHLIACTDPLTACTLTHPQLELECFGLDTSDLDTVFYCRRFMKRHAPLREILDVMRETYCRQIGVEFMHIQAPEVRQWLIDRMEPVRNRLLLSDDQALRGYGKLLRAGMFEAFLHRRFIGQKRFSLEGAEVLIPVLDAVLQSCVRAGASDVIMGMAHRGRLNVLAHVLGKPYEAIFADFGESPSFGFIGDGDVKYHKGFSNRLNIAGHQIHVTLASNPSHLEAVNSVVEGKCRARQDRLGSEGVTAVVPVLIHGDASFSGQGSVMELFNMSRLEGYATGGTIHIVVNNQIGFTTLPRDARSSRYSTDVAKMLDCPVFHVQGDSPEAALQAIGLACEYRHEFKSDVVVELICYRRYGHNEGDEPAFTQPLMYQRIAERPSVQRLYREELIGRGVAGAELDRLAEQVREELESAFGRAPEQVEVGFHDDWSEIRREFCREPVDTSVSAETLLRLSRKLAELPPGFEPHPKVQHLMQKRFEAVLKGNGLDWGNAETLAYASLLDEGHTVRISGQDSCRGTFNHRHAVLHDIHEGRTATPLKSFAQNEAGFQIWNSLLSEFGVLGFEYGYSLERPYGLTVWEAQFGDFANGAQVIIDQFVASGETKWNRASGLVLLLPHGYEGQGAEHSSARIERFLQLCAGNNMIVAIPSTPAQMFHLLRRQLRHVYRKPLVVFTPKSLLRHPACVSSAADFTTGGFLEVVPDPAGPTAVDRVLICCGRIYYELAEERERRGNTKTAIVRIEQLYPLHTEQLNGLLSGYPAEVRVMWVQDEPENMGAWNHINSYFMQCGRVVECAARPADCSPAVASHSLHAEQQAAILSKAFDD